MSVRYATDVKFAWFGLVWFHGISTIISYLMPNPGYSGPWSDSNDGEFCITQIYIYIYIYIYMCVYFFEGIEHSGCG